MKFKTFAAATGALITVLATMTAGCQTGFHPAADSQTARLKDGGPTDADRAKAKETVVAKVNGVEIRNNAVEEMTQRVAATINQEKTPTSAQDIRKRALDQLILQELVIQEAGREGMRVDPRQLDKAMRTAISNMGHEEGYKAYLENQHITNEEFQAEIERYLLIQLMFSREISSKAGAVTEDDILKEYEVRKGEYLSPEKISVIDVVLFLSENDPASIKKAEEVLAKIKADKDRDPRNIANTDGIFVIQNLSPLDKEKESLLYNEARKLKQDELSGVIKGRDSLHILKVTEYKAEKQMALEEVKAVLAAKLKAEAMKKRREAWERELKKDAKIEFIDSADGK